MEADISIWRKPGHFYFALTRTAAEDECVRPRTFVLCRFTEKRGINPGLSANLTLGLLPACSSSAHNAAARTVGLPPSRTQTSEELLTSLDCLSYRQVSKAGGRIVWSFVSPHALASCVGRDLEAVPA
jgi:hypothetical protein